MERAPSGEESVRDSPMQPLTKRVLEAVAAAMGLDAGSENLSLQFEDGTLRRWSRRDEGNSPMELGRWDDLTRYELERLMGNV